MEVDAKRIWLVEGHDSTALRARTLEECCEANRVMMEGGKRMSGFAPIGVFQNMEMALAFERAMKKKIKALRGETKKEVGDAGRGTEVPGGVDGGAREKQVGGGAEVSVAPAVL